MKYEAPTKNGKRYWVPVVCKNKDHLVGYLEGMRLMEDLILDSLVQAGIDIDVSAMELFLDSGRFNDILKDGRRESELTDIDKKMLIKDLVETKTARMNEVHMENDIEDDISVLNVECTCGYGFYSWNSLDELPNDIQVCQQCGRIIIDYTGYDDSEFDYDG
jgi:hypothetical protein